MTSESQAAEGVHASAAPELALLQGITKTAALSSAEGSHAPSLRTRRTATRNTMIARLQAGSAERRGGMGLPTIPWQTSSPNTAMSLPGTEA